MYPANNDTKTRDDKQIKDIYDRTQFEKQYEKKQIKDKTDGKEIIKTCYKISKLKIKF